MTARGTGPSGWCTTPNVSSTAITFRRCRYDAFLFFDETEALHPLHVQPREEGEVPETFPSGM